MITKKGSDPFFKAGHPELPLRLASKAQKSIAELALASRRDPSAVSRDVSKLSELGLVKVEAIVNEGHGRKKVVTPVASTISISAAIGAA